MNFLILSRNNAKTFSYQKHFFPYVIISVTDISSKPVIFNKSSELKSVLRLSFDDIDFESDNAISDNDAKRIISFINQWKNQINLVVIHCEAGVSRSAGICAALMLWLNGSNKIIFDNSHYNPNIRCYRIVLREIQKHWRVTNDNKTNER